MSNIIKKGLIILFCVSIGAMWLGGYGIIAGIIVGIFIARKMKDDTTDYKKIEEIVRRNQK